MKTIYAEAQPWKVVLKEKEIPAPGKGEVLLKAKYSAMSPRTENGLLGEHIVPLPTSMDMLLQPVVENAIKHGLREKRGEGTVAIRVSRNEDILQIVVMDDGIGMDENQVRQMPRRMRLVKKSDTIMYASLWMHLSKFIL